MLMMMTMICQMTMKGSLDCMLGHASHRPDEANRRNAPPLLAAITCPATLQESVGSNSAHSRLAQACQLLRQHQEHSALDAAAAGSSSRSSQQSGKGRAAAEAAAGPSRHTSSVQMDLLEGADGNVSCRAAVLPLLLAWLIACSPARFPSVLS
jgi:hypothetical protein